MKKILITGGCGFLGQHLIHELFKKKGYKTVVGDDVYCLHYKPPGNWNLQNGVSQAIIEFRCGLVYSHMYEYMFLYPVFMFHWFIQLSHQGAKGLLPSQRSPKMI